MYKIRLSPYAEIFYNEWLLSPDSSIYNIVMDQTFYGNLSVEKLKSALVRYVAEHVILNSHIQSINGEPYWVKNDSISELDYSNNTVDHSELLNYVSHSFDLCNEPLYRFKLLRIGEGIYRFIAILHHIVVDGSSTDDGVFDTISNYYNSDLYVEKYSINEQVKLIASLTETLAAKLEQNKAKYKSFWHNKLANIESVDLKFLKLDRDDNEQTSAKKFRSIKEIDFSYGDAELTKFNHIKRKYIITPYIYSLCIFALLVNKYTSQKRLAIGHATAIKEGVHFIYGAQVNTNFIPYQFNKSTTIVDLFNQSKEFFKSLKQDNANYSYYPIIDIIQENNKNLLNMYFIQPNFKDKAFGFSGITKVEISNEFNLDAADPLVFEQAFGGKSNKLNYRVKYDKSIINEELINSFVNAYKKLFLEVLDDLLIEKNDRLISSYSLLDQQQYQRIVYEFNKTDKIYPRDKTIHALFEEQVGKTPHNTAIVYEDTKLTYQDLNNKANQLANYLRHNHKIKPDDLVVLCLDRSEQMLIAILGVLKSGGAYVPIDPKLPDEGINYILDNTKARVILTNKIYQNRLRQLDQQERKSSVISIDDKKVQVDLAQQTSLNPNASIISSNLVYVLYTSGTTGNPKGVMLEHATCINRILEMISTSNLLGNERVLFKTNYVFDVSFSDIFTTLLTGGALIVTKNVFDIDEIAAKFVDYSIDICHFTPSQFEAISSIKGMKLFEKLRILNFSGEALYPKILNGIGKNILCANYYGPTEAGEVTFENTKLTKSNDNSATIGRALHNVKLFILDDGLMPLPIGAVGELYIGGVCLARGYLNNLGLTKEKFIANPLQTEQEKLYGTNNKLYKTGDLVRRLPDGNIEYVGRNDAQVKVRGYRIELGDIENQLLKFAGIKQVVAAISEQINDEGHLTTDKHLVAYYVADRKLDDAVLYNYLLLHLPEYMVPNAIIYLNELPLTPNGKLDIVQLPKIQLTKNYIAPNNRLQNTVAAIWSEILKVPKNKIGITESFFHLGGTSLSIIRLQHELSKLSELKNIKVVDLFKYTTIEQLTTFIEHNCDNEPVKIIKYKKSKKLGADTDIAIIAISGEFSGCKNIAEYWDLIQFGKEGLKSATIDECKQFGIAEEVLQNPNFLPRSGHVFDTDKFDADFWGITPNEAKNMDPQIRKFLEHCWYLLEISGYVAIRHKINTSIFVGGGDSVYVTHFTRQPLIVASGIGNLNIKDALATRVAYLLGLIGSANNINTACSTGLVTVIEACKSLSGGYCDMAIAGGVALLLPEEVGYVHQEGMIFSQDGHCRAFDYRASGTVPGSGVGAVLLKRLTDAKKDNDNILAIIKGYATNNDGNRKISYTAPSIIGQKECIINAQKMAKVTSDEIDYIECHGTGTKLGDPIEVQALTEVFAYNTNKNNVQRHKCIVGAVKANIGHAGAAAGIAGLIKVCQMLQHKIISKQINYDAPNAELHLDDTNFEIVTATKKWDKTNDATRIAGVSAFGIGGTNAHVIVSEYIPDNQIKNAQVCSSIQTHLCNYILPLSAKSNASLEAYKRSFIDYLNNTTDEIKDIAYTLQLWREHFDCRLAIVCNSAKDAVNKLKANVGINRINNKMQDDIIFMFPGQGNQYTNMSFDLYQHDGDYKKIVDECIRLANEYTNIKFEKILFPGLFGNEISNDNINQTQWAQLALFIVEYSLAKLLEALNVNAVNYIGHSIGEYVAATLSGVFSLKDAIKLVIARGQLMQSMPEGAMLSIQANAAEIEQMVRNNHCEIAVINAPKNCVASGTHEYISSLKAALNKINISTILLKVSHAYHSHFMMDASKKFMSQFKQIKLKPPQKRFISNVTGNFITANDAINPEYWARHMREPVLFATGIKTLFDNYNNLFFIEVGVGKSSISFVKQSDIAKHNVVQLLNSQKDNSEGIQDSCCKEHILSRLWVGGYSVNFDSYYSYNNCSRVVRLPNYCFDNTSYWIGQSQNVTIPKVDLSGSVSDISDIKSKVIEQDQPDKCYEIAKIFLDVLGIEKISIHDSFSSLGGDSFLVASLVAKLQQNYKINIIDFLKLQTIANVAKFAPFVEDNLIHKLEQIKLIYAKKELCLECDVEKMLAKKTKYLLEAQNITLEEQKKNIRNVLLTGATGHVGCNILHQLLHGTGYKIYLPVRAKSHIEACKRINNKFKYYFDTDLGCYKDRIVILVSDLEQPNLGVSLKQYQELVVNIDSIIHSAASVKHYGDYDEAHRANVQSTINLLELSRLTTAKDFHYVSTIAVATEGYVPSCSYFVFNEDDDASVFIDRNHIYATTKHKGEVAVNEYRKYGLTSNIYRLGNIAMHSINYRHQENISDNSFFMQFKAILQLGMIYKELSEVEITPVDYTATAIVKIFDQVHLSNQNYHIFNPHSYNLGELFTAENIPIQMYSFNEFVDNIVAMLNTRTTNHKQIELFMLHQKWLQEVDVHNVTKIKILQNKTEAILSKLGFNWPKITKEMWADIVKRALIKDKLNA